MEWMAVGPLAVATWCDLRSRTIPDWCCLAVAGCGMLRILGGYMAMSEAVLSGLVLGAIMLVGALVTDGIGGGDVKLCAALGLAAGLHGLEIVVWGVLVLVAVGKLCKLKELPFAPFLMWAYTIFLIWS